MLKVILHKKPGFIHISSTGKNASEQGFYGLSTVFTFGFYYYLYIKELLPQANPSGLLSQTKVLNYRNAMKDFQPEKRGAQQ